MRLWKNRPLLTLASVFMGASLGGFFLVSRAKLIAACLCLGTALLFAVGLLLYKQRTRITPSTRAALAVCLLLTASLALFQSLWAIDRTEDKISAFEGMTCTVEATVIDCRSSGGNMSTYTVEVHAVNGESVSYNALLTCYYISDLQAGFEITMTVEAVSLTEAAGEVYEEYLLMGDGIFGGFLSLTEEDLTIIDESPDALSLRLSEHRSALSLEMERLFGKEASGLPSALLLGERDHLPAEVRRDFARTGVSHILAISGLHMTLLFGLMAAVLKLCHIPPRGRAVILGVAATAYLLYLGFPPSATRAVIMLGMTYLASLCFAGADPLTSLGVAGMGILLISPTTVADVGFWMSFSATLGLLAVLPLLTRPRTDKPKAWTKRILSWTGGLCAGLVAVTFSLWVTAPVMGEMSLLSAPMTLLLTPLTGLLLVLVPLTLLLSPTPVGGLLVIIVREITALMTELCELFADPSWVVVSLRHPVIPWIAAAMVLLTLLLLGLSLPKKGLVLLPMLSGWVIIGAILGIHTVTTAEELQVSYLVPSTTSEMLVMTQGREAVICELSNGSRRSFLTAAEEAAKQGATELSAVILTDYHSSTSGSLLMLARRETVRALWMPEPTNEDDYYLMLACLEVAELTETPVVLYDHGEDLTLFASATLTVERTEIKRSVQPVLLLTLETPCERTVICGRSILESELALPALVAMAESETVILSNKGPVLKKAMNCTFGPAVEAVYCANKTVAAYISPDRYPDSRVAVTVGQGRFTLMLSE